MVNFVQNISEMFFSHNYMLAHFPKCWNEAVYMRKKQTYIFVLSVKPNTVLKLLE